MYMLDLKCMKIEPKQECCEKCQQSSTRNGASKSDVKQYA